MMGRFSKISIQTVKDYWNARPCNFKHSPNTPGTKEYYDEVEKKKFFVESHLVEFAEIFRFLEKKFGWHLCITAMKK